MEKYYLYNVFGQPGVSITTNGDELQVSVKPLLVNFRPFSERVQRWFRIYRSPAQEGYIFNFTLHVSPADRKSAIEILGGIYAETQRL